MVVSYFGF